MKLNLSEPFACDKLLASVVSTIFPAKNIDFTAGGEAILLAAGDEVSEECLGGEGSFEHFQIEHGQILFTYGYDLPEVDLQIFLIANTDMDEVYSICFLDIEGKIYRTVRDFDIGSIQ
ncbi:hypothetical protein [Paenibacillus sp. PAMC21692]|uniref:hypothetical protein n=1 Tax=Paenibacillus sp. PAMC21692 TaxID=2762320 RepID=UPI00164D0F53|nr:hypothetical protein [Paenibacillus sp. PAMC21692]QNK57424.1 hypothetical protein H7F31_34005 [Paenibacillus sp. PAMC21692]